MTEGPPFVSDEPSDRLTYLCAQMTAVLNIPDNQDVQAIVFLSSADSVGIQTHGYADQMEAMAELLLHIKTVFESIGKDFGVITDQGILRFDPPRMDPDA